MDESGGGGVKTLRTVARVHQLTRAPASRDDVVRALKTILRANSTTFDGRSLVAMLKKKGLEVDEDFKNQPILMSELTEVFRELDLSLALICDLATWEIHLVHLPPVE